MTIKKNRLALLVLALQQLSYIGTAAANPFAGRLTP
jgi:hypothetical protein